MTISTEKKTWTDEEFMALPDDGGCYELVNGKLVDMGNSGMEHGYNECIIPISVLSVPSYSSQTPVVSIPSVVCCIAEQTRRDGIAPVPTSIV
jgi:Uma2 family endonuclease